MYEGMEHLKVPQAAGAKAPKLNLKVLGSGLSLLIGQVVVPGLKIHRGWFLQALHSRSHHFRFFYGMSHEGQISARSRPILSDHDEELVQTPGKAGNSQGKKGITSKENLKACNYL